MKIRNGFVSNSSSSSFLIYGAYMDSDKVREAAAKVEGMNPEDVDLYDVCFEGLEAHSPDYSDGVYLGLSWDSIGDNQTGAEFKKSVADALEKLFGEPVKCCTHSESWYN